MATTTPRFGTSFSGSGWKFPGDAGSSDNKYATSPAGNANTLLSEFVSSGPDFSDVDDGDAVLSVIVNIECRYFSRPVRIEEIQVIIGGVPVLTPQGPTSNLTTSDVIRTFTFDVSSLGLLGSDIKSSAVGCRTVFKRTSGKGTGSAGVDGVSFQLVTA